MVCQKGHIREGRLVRADTARETFLIGKSMARATAETTEPESRLAMARSFVSAVIESYWQEVQGTKGLALPIHSMPETITLAHLSESAVHCAKLMGQSTAKLDPMEAGYLIGGTYTVMLPADIRSNFGAYYTPPALCERLLDMATEAGVDWATCYVLDPACGGGAFLSPIARRMADKLAHCEPSVIIENIATRIRGFELDPFAAWVSHVFLEATLMHTVGPCRRRMPQVVRVCDSLQQKRGHSSFDLVVGNPPYGRITLPPKLRERYKQSLFGHANLYGVFTDLALRFTRPGGVIAYVTPTSFLAGEYFKSLRGLLAREAPPAGIDFVVERRGVFEDVQQETMLAAYRRRGNPAAGVVHFVSPGQDGEVQTIPAGSFSLPKSPHSPWIVQRRKEHGKLVRRMRQMRHRLADYGYTVSTGPLVWNRHKELLRDTPGHGRYPLIWAESVRPNGYFDFRSQKRNHKPFFAPGPREMWVVTYEPCVLLQRTTAKEQARRLIAAELPESFLAKYGAVVVENHLNMVRLVDSQPRVAPPAVAALLNSDVVDEAFRCINGSVAVSAYELEALPLPSPKAMTEIDWLVKRHAPSATIERRIRDLYLAGED